MNRLLIVGASGHARVVADAVRAAGALEVAGFADRDHSLGESVFGFPVLGSDREIAQIVRAHAIDSLLIAVGDNDTRARLALSLHEALSSTPFATVIHPTAYVGTDVQIGEGSVVLAGAILNPGVKVGRHCIVNTKASVDHDCVLGDFVTVAPGATLGGNVSVGENSTVGLGANVIQSISIGRHSILGAGATAVANIPDRVVAFGVPARVVRVRQPGDP